MGESLKPHLWFYACMQMIYYLRARCCSASFSSSSNNVTKGRGCHLTCDSWNNWPVSWESCSCIFSKDSQLLTLVKAPVAACWCQSAAASPATESLSALQIRSGLMPWIQLRQQINGSKPETCRPDKHASHKSSVEFLRLTCLNHRLPWISW